MTWFARHDLAQALRWIVVWVALLIAAAIVALLVLRQQRDWAFGLNLETKGPVPIPVAVSVAVCALVLGPPLSLLAIWRFVRR